MNFPPPDFSKPPPPPPPRPETEASAPYPQGPVPYYYPPASGFCPNVPPPTTYYNPNLPPPGFTSFPPRPQCAPPPHLAPPSHSAPPPHYAPPPRCAPPAYGGPPPHGVPPPHRAPPQHRAPSPYGASPQRSALDVNPSRPRYPPPNAAPNTALPPPSEVRPDRVSRSAPRMTRGIASRRPLSRSHEYRGASRSSSRSGSFSSSRSASLSSSRSPSLSSSRNVSTSNYRSASLSSSRNTHPLSKIISRDSRRGSENREQSITNNQLTRYTTHRKPRHEMDSNSPMNITTAPRDSKDPKRKYSVPRESTSPSGSTRLSPRKKETERERLLKSWRSNFCETSEEITQKLAEIANSEEKETWIRSSPAEIYYRRLNGSIVESTARCSALCEVFEDQLIKRVEKARANLPPYEPPDRKKNARLCHHKCGKCTSSDSSEEEFEPEEDSSMEELSRKIAHPQRLHPDLWHNEPGEMNDGPLCRCSIKSRRTGIRHGIYPGEIGFEKCKPNSNNADKLYHYRITISPPTNFLTKTPTIINHDQHEFIFEGFSLLSHVPIRELPTCKVIRFNIEYTIHYVEEQMPENFSVKELDLFFDYLFRELLELVDFHLMPAGGDKEKVCPCYHFLPRFVRDLEDNGKEVLAMSEVLKYLLDSSGPLVDRNTLENISEVRQHEWQDYVDFVKGMVVTNPSRRPCSVRVDQLDRDVSDLPECVDTESGGLIHPVIVHFGIRPPQLSYAGNRDYQKAWREYSKFRHLVANMSKPTYDDKRKLKTKEEKLEDMRTQCRAKRCLTVAISSKGFNRTGIMCDIVQHAMLIPVLTNHLRFHHSLDLLEEAIDFKFKNRYLLQLALTHPSYRENFGTNPDHARNSLTNCGIRQPEYGDRKIHYMNIRKRGINTLINIMSRFGKEYETDSNITHNERLEFLGDAVVEFLTSIHLFFMFPGLEEGGLATYRAAIVQNQHLAVLASRFQLERFMLYAHGSDLCNELELRHAMANCFEALMGALLLDGGITVADQVFARSLWMGDEKLKEVWTNYPPHPLQEQEPLGDRKWIDSYQMLKGLTKFEESIGVEFKHIRLLARAFTDRSIGFTHLTLGSNQRLEFLGDTVLQLICSEYLYRHFPEHHEGHLSLLRSSLVNNRTQATVCDDLGMTQYAVYSNPKADLKTKDRADLLEAFLGALYVDKGLEYCDTFCHVCLFPRLQIFIMNQDWNDPKSKLQQCCLTLRTMDGGEPDIPIYKVIECVGPTNTRIYTVAVYFRGKRLASGTGSSIQQAEMNAAKHALDNSRDLFPQLDHQRRVITESIKRQGKDVSDHEDKSSDVRESPLGRNFSAESNLPKQYRIREDNASDKVSDSNSKSRTARSSKHGESSSSKHKKHKHKDKEKFKDTNKDRDKHRKKKRSRSDSRGRSESKTMDAARVRHDSDSDSSKEEKMDRERKKKKSCCGSSSKKTKTSSHASKVDEVSDTESGEIV